MLEDHAALRTAWIFADHNGATGSKILELAKNAHNLFVLQDSHDQARLLKMLVSNCTFDRGSLSVSYIKPFDLLVDGNENGNWLATVGYNRASLWFWHPADLIEKACVRSTRNFTREEWRQYLGDELYNKTCPGLPGAGGVDERGSFAVNGIVISR
jgi:hypothetical protein